MGNIGSKPVSVIDVLYSKNNPDSSVMADTNSNIGFNKVSCNDDIYATKQEKLYSFLNNKVVTSTSYPTSARSASVSLDFGETYEEVNRLRIQANYFFLSEERNQYTRDVYNAIDILSELGGLATSILSGLLLFVGVFNSLISQMHFVNLLYFDVKKVEKLEHMKKPETKDDEKI